MRLLALDTSTEYLSLALWQDGKVLVREQLAGQTHSERILPLIRELLDEAGCALKDCDGIVYGEGPGSFTGLRIACGVTQGLAFGADLPVLGVGTLEALAHQALEKHPTVQRVITSLDARMSELYLAAYERENEGWQAVLSPGLFPPDHLPGLEGEGWCAIGSGWDQYGDALSLAYGAHVTTTITGAYPLARHMVQLAAPRFAAGQGKPAHLAEPLYLRNKVALTIREREAK